MEEIYFCAPDVLRRTGERGIDTDLLIRQGAGHYRDTFHGLGVGAPCYRYGRWLLLWTAMIISPGLRVPPFNGKKAGAGGSFVEGVLVEWPTDPTESDSWEVRNVR